MVGDSAQAIYGWRGARDVMTDFDATALTLTRSFRFGPLLAEQANRWLELAEAPIRLTGSETIPTEVGDVANPDAVLCRTNIGAMAEVMRLLSEGHRVALARGGHMLASLALAARDLKEGRRTSHSELVLFASWGDVQDYATYDPAADVTVSTAHKAKGREWPTVRIGDDFPPPKDTGQHDAEGRPIPEPVNDTDARLAYVAVTRARRRLDLGGCPGSTHIPRLQVPLRLRNSTRRTAPSNHPARRLPSRFSPRASPFGPYHPDPPQVWPVPRGGATAEAGHSEGMRGCQFNGPVSHSVVTEGVAIRGGCGGGGG